MRWHDAQGQQPRSANASPGDPSASNSEQNHAICVQLLSAVCGLDQRGMVGDLAAAEANEGLAVWLSPNPPTVNVHAELRISMHGGNVRYSGMSGHTDRPELRHRGRC